MENDVLESNQYVIFKLNSEIYAIDIKIVKIVEKILPITRVPKVRAYIRGVINLRGDIIPVMDLRKRFSEMNGVGANVLDALLDFEELNYINHDKDIKCFIPEKWNKCRIDGEFNKVCFPGTIYINESGRESIRYLFGKYDSKKKKYYYDSAFVSIEGNWVSDDFVFAVWKDK